MATAVTHRAGNSESNSEQNRLLDYVYDELRKGNSVAIEAYPGFGKTRLGSQLLTRFDRAVMVVRTHQEMVEVFNFVGKAKSIAYAYGKPKLCFRADNFSYGFCRAMLFFGRCDTKVTNRDVAWVAATFRKPEEIREESRKRGRCLYFALRILAQSARRVVATYDYLVSSPEVLDGKEVAVLDEAHTVLNYLDEASITVNEAFIEALAKDMKKNPDTRWLAYAVKAAYRRSANVHEFVDNLSTVYSSYSGPETDAVKVIDAVLEAYRRKHYVSDGRTYYFLSDTLPRVARFEPKLLLGVYLPPMLVPATKNVIRVPGEPRVKLVVDTDLTSRYEERGEDVYTGYAKKLSEYVRDDVGNLAVFPSAEFMAEVLRRSGISGKVITEPMSGEVKPGYVLADVAGGRFTEGVNIRGIGNVVVCGMPYPEPDPLLDLATRAYRQDLYTYTALLRTVQAIGRIRGGGTAYAIDRRFAYYVDKLPKWVEVSSSTL